MATSEIGTATRWKRILITLAVLAAVAVGGMAYAAEPAGADANLAVGSLAASGANATVDGNVSTVDVTADLAYSYDVPDAERYIVRLLAGPTPDRLQEIAYTYEDVSGGTNSGTVQLSGSVLDTDWFSASDFTPDAVGGNATTDVIVAAEIEVQRANGETVTDRVSETAAVTVHDGTALTAAVGGSANLTVG